MLILNFKTLLMIIIGVLVLIIAGIGIALLLSDGKLFAGTRPAHIGVHEGQLATCPDRPNCVSSYATPTDGHHIAPLAYTGDAAQAINDLQSVLETMESAQVIKATEDYVYAEFTSKLLRFVDDVEFLLDDTIQVIHVRSASRLGHSDLGVNRHRIETIRTQLQQFSE